MRFTVLSLFPDVITHYLSQSLLGRAQKEQLLETAVINLRDYAVGKHRTVDDTPYGGGPGMVMKVEPVERALTHLESTLPRQNQRVIVLSARGTPFTQARAQEYATSQRALTLICGRYEGIDQRVADHLADEELAIGPYVLAGGELAAMVVIEAVARLLPSVLGNEASLTEESFSDEAATEYPHYTKPEDYQGWRVPQVLLSGDHEAIRRWRNQHRRA